MKILFIKKQYNKSADGGDIYNIKLINGLKELGNEVTEYSVIPDKKGLIPFWKWKISNQDVVLINKIQNNFDKTIISHESLAKAIKTYPFPQNGTEGVHLFIS